MSLMQGCHFDSEFLQILQILTQCLHDLYTRQTGQCRAMGENTQVIPPLSDPAHLAAGAAGAGHVAALRRASAGG